ncbi:GDSL esterase/lipase At5g22810 [Selaginella moellendorffii]|uniref:GDSL esterase/lipase At5g22810 n=1 Tax=Selaginella moellendorffii TaxID=88036 RepID=UPI000D1C5BAF|nr:GDSL esterase/lipase At5g22810 [Selaginella moellendorffii]|eukprot:XP_024538894.1 GDSL esterase/lipase At5g22810 [Selaginella moellendorffii]
MKKYLFMVLLLATQIIAQKFPALIIFGDSVVDYGNNNNFAIPFTIARANHSPYGRLINNGVPTGRYADGYTLPDFIALRQGYQPPLAYLDPASTCTNLLRGSNLASGGAAIIDTNSLILTPYTMTVQLGWLQTYIQTLKNCVGNTQANSIISNALYIFSVGSNDFSYKSFNPAVSGLSDAQYRQLLIDTYRSELQTAYNLGARNFFVFSLGPLGCTPITLTLQCGPYPSACRNNCNETTNQLVYAFDLALQAMLQNLQSTLAGSTFYYSLAAYNVTYDAVKNPGKYGLSVVDRGCCGLGYTEIGDGCNVYSFGTCSNASPYIFFDAIHPTSSFTQKLAPGTYTLLGI